MDTIYDASQANDELLTGEDLESHQPGSNSGSIWSRMDSADRWAWLYVVGAIGFLWLAQGVIFKEGFR